MRFPLRLGLFDSRDELMTHKVTISLVVLLLPIAFTAIAEDVAPADGKASKAEQKPPSFETIAVIPIPGDQHLWDVCTDERASFFTVSGAKKHIRLFDTKTRKLMWKVDSVAGGIAAAPNGKFVVTHDAKSTRIKIWEVSSGKLLRTIEFDGQITSAEVSPDGKHIAVGRRDGVIVLFDSASGKRLRQLNTGWEEIDIAGRSFNASRIRMRFSPDGRHLAAFHSAPGELIVFRSKDYEVVRRFKTNSKILLCLAFSPDSRYVATGIDDHTVKLWDISGDPAGITAEETRRVDDLIRQLDSDDFKVREAIQAKIAKLDGKYRHRLTSHLKKAKSVEVKLRLTAVLKTFSPDAPAKKLSGHAGLVTLVSFSPNGRYLVASTDRTLFVWDVKDQKIVARLPGGRGIWLPDDSFVVSSAHGGGLRFTKIKQP